MHDVFRAPTEHEFENEISTSALQRRLGKSGGSKGDDDCCDDEDDMDDEYLNDLSNEPVRNAENDRQASEFNVLHSIPVKVVASAETVTEDALHDEAGQVSGALADAANAVAADLQQQPQQHNEVAPTASVVTLHPQAAEQLGEQNHLQ